MPASYVKEDEPVMVKKVVKKKELVNVPVKVQKKRIEKRYLDTIIKANNTIVKGN